MECFRGTASRTLRLVSAIFLGLAVGAAPQAAEATIYAGDPVRVGNGVARVIVATNRVGTPTSVSVVLSRAALDGLPGQDREYVLPMPAGAPHAGYAHVGLNWKPAGHPPAGVYSVPHFDVHFYLISRAEREAVTFRGADAARSLAMPDGALVPTGYVVPPETAVEKMGVHGLNTDSSEFHGKPFTHTFVYGYYAGRLTFLEPMVTLDYLRTRPDITVPVRTPRAYSMAGYYPTKYRVGFDASRGEYRISLLGLRPFRPKGQIARR